MENKEELRKEITEILSEKINKYLEEVSKEVEKLLGEISENLKNLIQEKEEALKKEVEEKIQGVSASEDVETSFKNKINELLEESEHKIEEELHNIAQEVFEKNKKNIQKNIEKAIKDKNTAKQIIDYILVWLKEQEDLIKENLLPLFDELKETQRAELSKTFEDTLKNVDILKDLKEYTKELIETQKEKIEENIKETLKEYIESDDKVFVKLKEEIKGDLEEEFKKLQESIKGKTDFEEEIKTLQEEVKNLKKTIEELKETLTAPIAITKETSEAEEEVEVTEETPPPEEVAVEEAPVEAVEKVEEVEKKGIKLKTAIEIRYFGHSSFLISTDDIKILTDPYKSGALDGAIKYDPIDIAADIVTVSHAHMDHGAWKEIPGEPKLVEVPGEKVIDGIKFKGIPAFHDNAGGTIRGSIMIYTIELAGVRLCHLGDLGHILTPEQIREIGRPVDILFIPVGGYYTIGPKEAWEVIHQLDPVIVIPMHYRTLKVDLPIQEVDAFIKISEFPVKELFKSSVDIEVLPTEPEVWVLDPEK